MQVTKGMWQMREQCVPGSLSSSPTQEPGNEATLLCTNHSWQNGTRCRGWCTCVVVSFSSCLMGKWAEIRVGGSSNHLRLLLPDTLLLYALRSVHHGTSLSAL